MTILLKPNPNFDSRYYSYCLTASLLLLAGCGVGDSDATPSPALTPELTPALNDWYQVAEPSFLPESTPGVDTNGEHTLIPLGLDITGDGVPDNTLEGALTATTECLEWVLIAVACGEEHTLPDHCAEPKDRQYWNCVAEGPITNMMAHVEEMLTLGTLNELTSAQLSQNPSLWQFYGGASSAGATAPATMQTIPGSARRGSILRQDSWQKVNWITIDPTPTPTPESSSTPTLAPTPTLVPTPALLQTPTLAPTPPLTPTLDSDGDTVPDEMDNCGFVPNADQSDLDSDGLGDLCDDDRDGDGYSEAEGDCNEYDPTVSPVADDITDEIDNDCDGLVDEESDPDPTPEATPTPTTDFDGDGVLDDMDNCSAVSNTDQIDLDGDGIGDLCDDDRDGDGYTEAAGDCDDLDPGVFPAAEDIPDGIDNDCDGQVDEETDYWDDDGDGYSEFEGDCNDSDLNIYPEANEVPYDGIDQDCNGEDLNDVDEDGYAAAEAGGNDCNDSDRSIHPWANEIPNDGIDQDCSGDDCKDVDLDGVCAQPGGNDCDDSDGSINPWANEIPNDGIDQDCSGDDCKDVDLDGFCAQPGGNDCDDSYATIHPGAKDVPYDGIDQDCSGSDLMDADGDGYDSQEAGGDDCNDTNPNIHPGVETPYDDIDQDCIEGDLTDVDGDGHAANQADGDDCNDEIESIHPGAVDTPDDGIDQNCDGCDACVGCAYSLTIFSGLRVDETQFYDPSQPYTLVGKLNAPSYGEFQNWLNPFLIEWQSPQQQSMPINVQRSTVRLDSPLQPGAVQATVAGAVGVDDFLQQLMESVFAACMSSLPENICSSIDSPETLLLLEEYLDRQGALIDLDSSHESGFDGDSIAFGMTLRLEDIAEPPALGGARISRAQGSDLRPEHR